MKLLYVHQSWERVECAAVQRLLSIPLKFGTKTVKHANTFINIFYFFSVVLKFVP
jgi:hypothetical protein